MNQLTPMVKQLLILNVIFYIGSQFVPQAYDYLALHYFQNSLYQPWQWISYMFMHAKAPHLMHILFNMYALYMFGSIVERMWGGGKFLFFYITCGIVAAIAQTGINYWEIKQLLEPVSYLNLTHSEINSIIQAQVLHNGSFRAEDLFLQIEPWLRHKEEYLRFISSGGEGIMPLLQAHVAGQSTMVGASGAIYGLMVAFAMTFPDAKLQLFFIPFGIAAKYFIPGILLLDLFSGYSASKGIGSGSNVAHFAHLGGALAGFLLMYYWKRTQFNSNRWN